MALAPRSSLLPRPESPLALFLFAEDPPGLDIAALAVLLPECRLVGKVKDSVGLALGVISMDISIS